MRPPDLPSAEALAQGKPHGERLRYMAGCRCLPCRAANSRYETARLAARRNGDWNGRVAPDKARLHLIKLSEAGVGRRAVSAASGVALTTIQDIRGGRKATIWKRTETRIMAVTTDCVSDGQIVDARETWRRIRWLLRNGFTRGELASRLGCKSRALQFGKDRVLARTELKVARFYRMIRAGE